jgi:CRISPR/Cas system-associated endonuclease/helicase Cas3
MKERKTRKLVCNVTGRKLFTSKDYYEKKVKTAGTEEILHKTYMCREAKDLLKKGYTVENVQETLGTKYTCNLSDSEIRDIIGNKSSLRINTSEDNKIDVIKTDPKVKKFIENILNNE